MSRQEGFDTSEFDCILERCTGDGSPTVEGIFSEPPSVERVDVSPADCSVLRNNNRDTGVKNRDRLLRASGCYDCYIGEGELTLFGTSVGRKLFKNYLTLLRLHSDRTGSDKQALTINPDDYDCGDLLLVRFPSECYAFLTGKGGGSIARLQAHTSTFTLFVQISNPPSRPDVEDPFSKSYPGEYYAAIWSHNSSCRRVAQLRLLSNITSKCPDYVTPIDSAADVGHGFYRLENPDHGGLLSGKQGATMRKLMNACGLDALASCSKPAGFFMYGTAMARRRAVWLMKFFVPQQSESVRARVPERARPSGGSGGFHAPTAGEAWGSELAEEGGDCGWYSWVSAVALPFASLGLLKGAQRSRLVELEISHRCMILILENEYDKSDLPIPAAVAGRPTLPYLECGFGASHGPREYRNPSPAKHEDDRWFLVFGADDVARTSATLSLQAVVAAQHSTVGSGPQCELPPPAGMVAPSAPAVQSGGWDEDTASAHLSMYSVVDMRSREEALSRLRGHAGRALLKLSRAAGCAMVLFEMRMVLYGTADARQRAEEVVDFVARLYTEQKDDIPPRASWAVCLDSASPTILPTSVVYPPPLRPSALVDADFLPAAYSSLRDLFTTLEHLQRAFICMRPRKCILIGSSERAKWAGLCEAVRLLRSFETRGGPPRGPPPGPPKCTPSHPFHGERPPLGCEGGGGWGHVEHPHPHAGGFGDWSGGWGGRRGGHPPGYGSGAPPPALPAASPPWAHGGGGSNLPEWMYRAWEFYGGRGEIPAELVPQISRLVASFCQGGGPPPGPPPPPAGLGGFDQYGGRSVYEAGNNGRGGGEQGPGGGGGAPPVMSPPHLQDPRGRGGGGERGCGGGPMGGPSGRSYGRGRRGHSGGGNQNGPFQ